MGYVYVTIQAWRQNQGSVGWHHETWWRLLPGRRINTNALSTDWIPLEIFLYFFNLFLVGAIEQRYKRCLFHSREDIFVVPSPSVFSSLVTSSKIDLTRVAKLQSWYNLISFCLHSYTMATSFCLPRNFYLTRLSGVIACLQCPLNVPGYLFFNEA